MVLEMDALAAELLRLERRRLQRELEDEETQRHRLLTRKLFAGTTIVMTHDRRQLLRIPADLEATFRLGTATIECAATELSMGGLSVGGHLWVNEDQELTLANLRFGDRDYPMTIRARVVWKISEEDLPPLAGVQFLDLADSAHRQVDTVFECLIVRLRKHVTTSL